MLTKHPNSLPNSLVHTGGSIKVHRSTVIFLAACFEGEVDIIFLIDTSEGIWDLTKEGLISFVGGMDDDFEISNRGTHVGIVVYNNDLYTPLELNDGTSLEKITDAFQNIQSTDGDRGDLFDEGLKLASKLLQTHKDQDLRNDPDAKEYQIIIPVILSAIPEPRKAIQVAGDIKSGKNVAIIPIGVEPNFETLHTLKQVASTPDRVYVESEKTLPNLWERHHKDIKRILCPRTGNFQTRFIIQLVDVSGVATKERVGPYEPLKFRPLFRFVQNG